MDRRSPSSQMINNYTNLQSLWPGYIRKDFRYWYHDWVACIYWWVLSVPWGGGGADDRQWLRRNSKFQLWWCAQHACRETIAAELRALRIVVEELLRDILSKVDTYESMMEVLETKASQSKTTQWWVENLVKPIFIMMLFVRAEREVDWPLHLWAVKEMIPYFFAAGHCNYARYATYYLHSMEKLSKKVFRCFMKGEHVMRHKPGYTEQCATCSNQTQTARVYQNADSSPSKHEDLTQCCFNVGPAPLAVGQYWNSIGSNPRVCWAPHRCLSTPIPPLP